MRLSTRPLRGAAFRRVSSPRTTRPPFLPPAWSGKRESQQTSILGLECSTSWQDAGPGRAQRDRLPSTASAARSSGQEGALTWNDGAADDLAPARRPCCIGRPVCWQANRRFLGADPGSTHRICPTRSHTRSPTCTPSNPPSLD